MDPSLENAGLPGYKTFIKPWILLYIRLGFLFSAGLHLLVFGLLSSWWIPSGEPEFRPIKLPEWHSTHQLFLENIPVIEMQGGGGGPGSSDAAPGPGKGGVAVETPPLAIPVPVPDELLSDPEATIVTQDIAEYAGIVRTEKSDTLGGGGGGGSGGGYGGGGGAGVGPGFGLAGFQTPPRPVKIVLPEYPKSMRDQVSKVLFLILIDEAGNVIEDRVVESSRSAFLDSLAAAAVRQSRFIPAKQNGKDIKAWTRYEVKFGTAE